MLWIRRVPLVYIVALLMMTIHKTIVEFLGSYLLCQLSLQAVMRKGSTGNMMSPVWELHVCGLLKITTEDEIWDMGRL